MSNAPLPIRARDIVLVVVGIVFAVLLGIVVGIAAMMGVAVLTTEPTIFLFAGSACCATVIFAVAAWVSAGERRRALRIWTYPASLVLVGALVTGLLLPMGDPQFAPAAVADRQVADLSTGSQVSYVEINAPGARSRPPVVVLHGGPGVPQLKGDADFFGQLVEDGFDVYVYDRIGSGWSARLDDPTEYDRERHLADLESFRAQVVRSTRMILVGHSAGARLGAAYTAEYAQRVTAFVATSPQTLRGEADESSVLGRLGWRDRLGVVTGLLHPRALTAYSVLQVSPRAAHEYVGDAELDARFDRLYARARPALRCAGEEPGPALRGLGFFANFYPQSWSYPDSPDLRPRLTDVAVPTLVVKGSCDYVDWTSAREYRDTLPDARLVYLPEVGHNVAYDAPGRFLALLRAFLNDEPLPVAPYTGDRPPPGFDGPG